MSVVKAKKFEIVRGSGNAFADFGRPDAELLQLKALLAAQVIKALDEMGLTVRKAQSLTGTAAADFSRLRSADLGRFTIDRLMTILNRLNREVKVTVEVKPFLQVGREAGVALLRMGQALQHIDVMHGAPRRVTGPA